MCGIAGSLIFNNNDEVDFNLSNKIKASLKKRGPDGDNIWISKDKKVSLIHTRLSIYDTSQNGQQPMSDTENKYMIIFNGSIFNYKELQFLLKKKGYKFISNTDTEVILNLYKEKGIEFTKYLKGIYAIAIYDLIKKEMIIARDEIGIKPLYICWQNNTFFFSSLVKSLTLNNIKLKINQNSIINFYLYGHISEPNTMYEDIFALEPGSTLRVNSNGLKKIYQNDLFNKNSIYKSNSKNESLAYLDYQISKNIKIQNRSDVKSGIFLSSGIDSSKILIHSKNHFDAININFEEYKNTKFDESLLPKKLTKITGHNLLSKYYTKDECLNIYEKYFENMDQPTMDGFNTFLASKFASENNFKVILSGLGGDEIFFGYKFYSYVSYAERINKYLNQLKIKFLFNNTYKIFKDNSKISKFFYVLGNSNNLNDVYFNFRKINYENVIAKLDDKFYTNGYKNPNTKLNTENNSYISNIKILEISNYIKNQLLKDSDWASMSNAVELRVPFLDKKIINFALFDPHISELKKKNIIQFNKNVSKLLFNRKKTGFTTPLDKWQSTERVQNTDFVLKKYFKINNLTIQ